MKDRYLAFGGGRMCNLLYYALHTYIRNKSSSQYKYRYLCGTEPNCKQLSDLGLSELICFPSRTINERVHGKKQRVNVDFSISQARDFIREYILASPHVQSIVSSHAGSDSAVAIHIRNGDYLSPRYHSKFSCFDRNDYINRATQAIQDSSSRDLYVFSDDIELCKKQYGTLLGDRFGDVVYMPPGIPQDDLIRLSCFRNKILFNSTFSVWSGFIGNTLYPASERGIIAPGVCWSTDRSKSIYDPSWNILGIRMTV